MPTSWPEPRILDDFHQIDTETRDALELLEAVEPGGPEHDDEIEDDEMDPDKKQVCIARDIQDLSKGILRYLKASESQPASNFDHQNATGQFPQDLFRTSWSFLHVSKLPVLSFVFRIADEAVWDIHDGTGNFPLH